MEVCRSAVQRIRLEAIPGNGPILDIGAGGEGLVSRIAGSRVCAVDIRIEKIREAQIYGAPANWIVGDARHLCFKEGVFEWATFWFSLAYMRTPEVKRLALREAYRVLSAGGMLSILAARVTCGKQKFCFRALFEFPNGELSQVGYGVRGDQNQTIDGVSQLIRAAGFSIVDEKDNSEWFKIIATKE